MTDSEKYQLDAVAGAQLAFSVAIKLLLMSHRGNNEAATVLGIEMEAMRARLLASSSSDYKIQAFEEAAAGLCAVLKA